jgi:hypothetical protein
MTPTLTKEVQAAIWHAIEEVDAQLVHEIRAARTDRERLLNELDVLQKVRDRINARIN